MFENQLLDRLRGLMKHKKSKKFYAERLAVSEDIIEELLKELREVQADYTEAANYAADLEEEFKIIVDNDRGTRKSEAISSFEPKNDIELAELHKVDLKKYKISNYWTKQRGEKFMSSLLCSLRKAEDVTAEDVFNVLNNYTPTYQPHTKLNLLVNDVYAEPCSAFIDLTDFHLAKKELQGTTIEDKRRIFYSVIDRLLYKSYRAHKLEEIVFVIGSDFFHTDNHTTSPSGNTERGTGQETTVYWHEEFEIGFDIYATTIIKLKQYCENLKVILVQGNHDRTKSFYLAHGLSKYFSTDPSIIFDITPTPRKVHIYGQNFIGLHHGDCKINDLPLVFAQEFSEQWGPCKFKEIKVGDKHFYMEKEVQGVRVKQLPSLSGTDTWHNAHNFHLSTRAALCSIYHPTKGRVTEFEERLT